MGGNTTTCSEIGCGTVFKVDTSGNETVLYSFSALAAPSGLVLDAAGNLYGTTSDDGTSGYGTVFKLDPAGNETVLYNFTGAAGDGIYPIGNLILDAQGNLYGTTNLGGARTQCGGSGCGTVFKIDAKGNETVLYRFVGITPDKVDGSEPHAGLVMDALGNLYGTTAGGGITGCGTGTSYGGCGTVFKLDTSGNETLLYTFTGGADGGNPYTGLVQDPQGNFYGTTHSVNNSGGGVVFKLDTTNRQTVLHTFPATAWDGAEPTGIVLDRQGNIYGTTFSGGVAGSGTVFKIDTAGKETVLHHFNGGVGRTDGALPDSGLVMDPQGNFYGTTEAGGTITNGSAWGTVFKLRPAPATTTKVTSSQNPLIEGYNLTLTATVTSTASGTPTGTVFFYDSNFDSGAVPIVSVALDSAGVANFTASLWPLGSNRITAIYGGDSNDSVSISAPPFVEIVQEATTTSLTSTPNPSTYGQEVTFTAVVNANLGPPPNGETVSFMKGKTVLGTASLSKGTASFTTSTLPVGATPITAVYPGDAKLSASQSEPVKQVVTKATTTSALTSSVNPSQLGQPVTFSATVTPQFGGKVTGTVAFYDGTTLLKSVALNGGTAKFTTSKLAAGSHSIVATYDGSADFSGSSATLTQTVNVAATLISIAVQPPSSTLGVGASEPFSAYGTYSDGSTQNITSSVAWKSSKTSVATITSGGLATAVAAGTATIAAHSGPISGTAALTIN
jgi:uncharacterized repeat protein (TIGR03803 family)